MPNIILEVDGDNEIDLALDTPEMIGLSLSESINATYANLSPEVKQALLDCFAHVAWIDEHGQDYYDALYTALYPPIELDYITAVYTQSGTVYDSDSLDSLKADLVVTAYYDDGTSAPVTAYTLSGTLTAGTSTITVSYDGKTDTFSVEVTASAFMADKPLVYISTLATHVSWDTETQTATLRSKSVNDWPGLVLQGLKYKYSDTNTKKVRVRFSVTITGLNVSGTQGVLCGIAVYTSINPANNGTDRKASYLYDRFQTSGTFAYDQLIDVSNITGSSLDNYYLGAFFMINAASGATAVITDLEL